MKGVPPHQTCSAALYNGSRSLEQDNVLQSLVPSAISFSLPEQISNYMMPLASCHWPATVNRSFLTLGKPWLRDALSCSDSTSNNSPVLS